MKKKLLAGTVSLMAVLALAGCNKDVFGMEYDFEEAIIKLPDGTLKQGKVKQWTQSDGNYVRVTFENGESYLTGQENVVLIDK